MKPLREFSRDRRSFDRISGRCKACNSKALREQYAKHTEKRQEGNRRWRLAHPEEFKKITALHRVRKRNTPVVERVSLDVLYKRERGICGLCHTRMSRKDASMDHIVPLSKGGEHSYKNTVAVHKRCNSRKRNRAVTQQMRLF